MAFVPRRAAAAILVVGAISAVGAQDAVFRTSVDLVTVDAAVPGRDGRPVEGLGPTDFVLEVDGKPRRIVSAQFVSQAAPTTRPAPRLVSRHFTSNEQGDQGRYVVLAVDEAHIRRQEGKPALRAAMSFIDRLDPLDRIAVAPLTRIGTIEFTRDRIALKSRLEGLTGQTDPVFLQFNIGLLEAVEIADGGRARLSDVVLRECGRSLSEYTSPARIIDPSSANRDACPEQVEQEARGIAQHARTQARISMSALEALISALKQIEGPKTVVLLSEGMVLDPRLIDVSLLAAAAKDARVVIYVLHMEVPIFEAAQDRVSPTFLRDVQLRGDGLGRLAGATRGAVFRLVGSDHTPFDRVATEISGYYLLAFEAVESDRDGRVHRLTVRLARGGGEVRARPAFRMAPVVPSARSREEDLVALLRGAGGGSELPIRVATYTYAEPSSSNYRVVVSTEADAADGPAANILVGYVLTDGKGVIAASGAHLASRGRHAFSTVVPPGQYTLRVAGIDPLDRRGLVERPFATTLDTLGSLRASNLILAPVPQQADAPLRPFVDRIAEPRATVYLELYAPDAAELGSVGVSFEVKGSAAATPLSTRGEILRPRPGWVIARSVLPLGSLAPGSYTATARVSVAGWEAGTIARPFTYDPRDVRSRE